MTKGLMVTSLAFAALLASAPAGAQRRSAPKRTAVSRSGAEAGLLGIKLYDSGLRVVGLYGNPDQILPISGGGTAAAGGGGGAGSRGGFGGPGGGGSGGGGGAAGTSAPATEPTRPDLGPTDLNFQGSRFGPPGAGGDGGGGNSRPGLGNPGGGGGGSTTTSTGDFTRLIYTKSGSKFGFVLDKFNRVVQIEAIGLQNARVKTKRGIGFGSTFSQVMKAYGPSSPPDGYEVAGDQVTVKWLTRQRVAFRLTKLGTKQAHVVTGIVVAAGKG